MSQATFNYVEGATTIPRGSTLKRVEMGRILTDNAEDFDIVSSLWKHKAVLKERCKCSELMRR